MTCPLICLAFSDRTLTVFSNKWSMFGKINITQLLRGNWSGVDMGERKGDGELGRVRERESVVGMYSFLGGLGCILWEKNLLKRRYSPGYLSVAFDKYGHSKIITFISVE